MPDTPEVGEACHLDEEGVGWVRVCYAHDAVHVAGYGQSVGLRCGEALKLLQWLLRHQAFLLDRASNYSDCRECGSMHHRSVMICPTLMHHEQ